MGKDKKIIISFIIAIALSFYIFNKFWAFYIPSESMYPNYFVGDIVISKSVKNKNSFSKGLSYSFYAEIRGSRTHSIKRMIGSEGDTISFRPDYENNRYDIYVNGFKIKQEPVNIEDVSERNLNAVYEVYGHHEFDFFYETLNDNTYLVMYEKYSHVSENIINNYLMRSVDIQLGKNENFFIGDNRNNSLDSRYYGVIKSDEIVNSSRTVLFNHKFIINPNLRYFMKNTIWWLLYF